MQAIVLCYIHIVIIEFIERAPLYASANSIRVFVFGARMYYREQLA